MAVLQTRAAAQDKLLFDAPEERIWQSTDGFGDAILRVERTEAISHARFVVARELQGNHPDAPVLPVLEIARHAGGGSLVVRAKPGHLLCDMIPTRGMRLGPLLNVVSALAEAVADLHARGILHRDLRPERILLLEDGANIRFLSLETAIEGISAPGVTAAALGASLSYAAPELTGRIEIAADERADLYSLGVTFFHMVAGHVPFTQTDPKALGYAHITAEPPKLDTQRPDVPAVLLRIIARLMRKDPARRYSTAFDLCADLTRAKLEYEKSGTIRDFELTHQGLSPRFQIPSGLFGRSAQEARLIQAAETGPLAGTDTIVTVSGPSGIGKTAFVSGISWRLAQSNARLHGGKFDRFQQGQPYLAFIETAQSMLRPYLSADADTVAELRSRLHENLSPYTGLLTDLVPELRHLMGPQPAVEDVPPAEATRRFNGVVGRFIASFARAGHPLVVFLDDVQWADHASLNLIKAIAEMLGQGHFMLILSYRSNEVGPGHPAAAVLD